MSQLQTAMFRARAVRFHVEQHMPEPKPTIIDPPSPAPIPTVACGLPAKSYPAALAIQIIIGVVAKYFQVTREEIKGRSRLQKYCLPRQIAMYLAHECNLSSYPEIGRKFNRDHTTAMSACRKISARVQDNPEFREMIEELKREILS